MRSATPPPYLNAILRLLTLVGCLVAVPAAHAASLLYIRGAGNGHGIGMSQYGADGYAQHGADDRAILAHYYQGTTIGQVSPTRTVRVLIADGGASFSGATAAGPISLRRTRPTPRPRPPPAASSCTAPAPPPSEAPSRRP